MRTGSEYEVGRRAGPRGRAAPRGAAARRGRAARRGGATRVAACAAAALVALGGAGCADGGGEAGRSDNAEAGAEALPPLAATDSALLDPTAPALNRTAPDSFTVRFATSQGHFLVRVHRNWAPRGADRFYNLVRAGFYDGVRFFRVLDGFVAQFGIHGDPRVSAAWSDARIEDDPVFRSNDRGTLSYAMAGPGTRTTQLFINLAHNGRLDDMGFAPFGEVVEGMEVVDRLHSGYGEGAPRGAGPDQGRIQTLGNRYLDREFPELDRVDRAEVVREEGDPVEADGELEEAGAAGAPEGQDR